jgi:hypothetical protein
VIRLANVGDTARVVEMLANAHPVSVMARYVDFSPEMAREQFLEHLACPTSLCLVHDVSGIAQGIFVGAASDYPSAPIRIGVEVVSWVEPSHRGSAWFKMKRQFETWAKDRGCKITSLSSKSDERFARAIERDGYQYVESHFVKVI